MAEPLSVSERLCSEVAHVTTRTISVSRAIEMAKSEVTKTENKIYPHGEASHLITTHSSATTMRPCGPETQPIAFEGSIQRPTTFFFFW